jgi:hypothetical protein
MQLIWKPFDSLPELIDAIDVSVPAPRPNIVSTRTGLKKFLQLVREGPDCTTGMRYALNQAISNLVDSEPLTFADCIGRPGFGHDTSKPVLRLVRRYFEDEVVNAEESLSEAQDVDADIEKNPPGHWKVRKAPSNRSTCTRCKENIAAGDWRIELGSASAIVANQGGRAITDYKHVACFFDWLGVSRRATTKGLRAVEDLSGYADVSSAEQEHFQCIFQTAKHKFRQRCSVAPRRARTSSAASASSPVRACTATATSPSSSHASPSLLPTARSRPERAPIRRGSVKSMLRMCAREQLASESTANEFTTCPLLDLTHPILEKLLQRQGEFYERQK